MTDTDPMPAWKADAVCSAVTILHTAATLAETRVSAGRDAGDVADDLERVNVAVETVLRWLSEA